MKKARAKIVALIAAIIIALGLASRPMSAADFGTDGCISDGAGILSEKTMAYITERNRSLEANCRGSQIAVVTLDTIEDYAQRLFEKENIGSNKENNGVLLLAALEDKDYYIVAGSGLSSVFTTKTLSGIIRNALEPAFRDGDYDGAIKSAFAALNEAVCRYYDVDPDTVVDEEGVACGSCTCSGLSCGSCGGVLLFGCAACIGYELFSSIGGHR